MTLVKCGATRKRGYTGCLYGCLDEQSLDRQIYQKSEFNFYKKILQMLELEREKMRHIIRSIPKRFETKSSAKFYCSHLSKCDN